MWHGAFRSRLAHESFDAARRRPEGRGPVMQRSAPRLEPEVSYCTSTVAAALVDHSDFTSITSVQIRVSVCIVTRGKGKFRTIATRVYPSTVRAHIAAQRPFLARFLDFSTSVGSTENEPLRGARGATCSFIPRYHSSSKLHRASSRTL